MEGQKQYVQGNDPKLMLNLASYNSSEQQYKKGAVHT